MSWLSDLFVPGRSATKDFWPEDCPCLLKQVSGGEVYRGCKILTVFSLNETMISPGQMNCSLDMLFSGICSVCDVPAIISKNPCEQLSLGVEVANPVDGADGKRGSVRIKAACSDMGTINSPDSCKKGCTHFNVPTSGEMLSQDYRTPALGTFNNQQQFAKWIALKLEGQGFNVAITDSHLDEWPYTLEVEIDAVSIAIKPGLDEKTGEPTIWIWSVGLGKVKPEFIGSSELSAAIESANNKGAVNITTTYLDDPSVLESIIHCEVKNPETTNIGILGTAKWPDTIEEVVAAFKAPRYLAYGIATEFKRFFPDLSHDREKVSKQEQPSTRVERGNR